MKTILCFFAVSLFAVGCDASSKPKQLSKDQQITILLAQTELNAANAAAQPYVQAAIEKEKLRNEAMQKALADLKCPTCRIDLVGGKLVVLDPPAPVAPPVKK